MYRRINHHVTINNTIVQIAKVVSDTDEFFNKTKSGMVMSGAAK